MPTTPSRPGSRCDWRVGTAGARRPGAVTAPADVAVVGAGPAGIGAAVAARRAGAAVLVIDSQELPGGQIWRGGAGRSRALSRSGAVVRPGWTVWAAEGRSLHITDGERSD